MMHDFPTPELQELALHEAGAVPAPVWNKLAGITTQTATSTDEAFENVLINIKRDIPLWHETLPKDKTLGRRIALVGGGPSVKDTIHEAADFDDVLVCGSAHDWVQANMSKPPKYCAVCDPDPVMANYLRSPSKETTYLISSHANPSVYQALEGYNVQMWHCWPIGKGDKEAHEFLQKHHPGWVAVGGGCTVGLRSISIAIMMGYSDIHFFGFDSCIGSTDDDHHAYPFTDKEKEFLGDIYNLRIGMGDANGPAAREYRVAGYQLAQADHYKQMLSYLAPFFKPTFHGPGLLADIQAMIDAEVARIEEAA